MNCIDGNAALAAADLFWQTEEEVEESGPVDLPMFEELFSLPRQTATGEHLARLLEAACRLPGVDSCAAYRRQPPAGSLVLTAAAGPDTNRAPSCLGISLEGSAPLYFPGGALPGLDSTAATYVPLRSPGDPAGFLFISQSAAMPRAARIAAFLLARRWDDGCDSGKSRASYEDALRTDLLTALGWLSASVAHDLRNPLGSLLLAVQNALIVQGSKPEAVAPCLNDIQRDARRCLAVLKFLSQIGLRPGGHRLHVELSELVGQTVHQMVKDPAYWGAQLKFHPGARPVFVLAEPSVLARAMENVISYALKLGAGSGARIEVVPGCPRSIVIIRAQGLAAGASIPDVAELLLARTPQHSAFALGPALAREVFEDYGGSISLITGEAESRLQIELPSTWSGQQQDPPSKE